MRDSGAAESTIQDTGWNGGQPHMAAPYSLDLRERVVAAVAAGMSRAQAAAHYQVSHSSAIRWTRRQAETGSPAALPMGGKKPFTLANEEAWIRARVEEKPDITGRELLAELNQRGIEISYYGVWHFVDHVGLSFKKKACAPANRIARMSRGGGGNGSSTRTRSLLGA
jgi:transposase